MTKTLLKVLAALVAGALAASPALAQTAIVDYVGYGWESGGVPPSNVGDALQIAAVADVIDPMFGVNLASEEATIFIYGLTSAGEFTDVNTGWTIISYNGGTLELYSDPARNRDWGTFPPNGSVPSTFTDGTLLFRGAFTSFTLIFTGPGAGTYEGNLDGVGGSAVQLCSGCAYTFGGAFTRGTGAQVLEGYDLQIDGTLEVNRAVPRETTGWGALKALYRN